MPQRHLDWKYFEILACPCEDLSSWTSGSQKNFRVWNFRISVETSEFLSSLWIGGIPYFSLLGILKKKRKIKGYLKSGLEFQALGKDIESIYVEELGTTLSREEIFAVLVVDPMAGAIEVDWRDFFPYLSWIPNKSMEMKIQRMDFRRGALMKALIGEQKKRIGSGEVIFLAKSFYGSYGLVVVLTWLGFKTGEEFLHRFLIIRSNNTHGETNSHVDLGDNHRDIRYYSGHIWMGHVWTC